MRWSDTEIVSHRRRAGKESLHKRLIVIKQPLAQTRKEFYCKPRATICELIYLLQ